MDETPSRYGIYGSDVKVGQYLDFAKPTFVSEPYLLIIQFLDVSLLDKTNSEIFKGTVILRLQTEPTKAALAVFERMLHSWKGHFDLVANGRVTLHGHYAQFYTDGQVLSTNFQPSYQGTASGTPVVIDPLTGEVK